MQDRTIHAHPSSIDAYLRHGWLLVPIPPGTKGPKQPGWQKRENAFTPHSVLPPGYGIGLAHAYSGTMALDIDNWDTAVALFDEQNINLSALYEASDAVTIESGKTGHGKLIYAMSFGETLPSKQINHDNKAVYNFRCATSEGMTVQDVLPPSIHPDTNRPYQWGGKGHWSRLPPLPEELRRLWLSLLEQDQQSRSMQPTQSTTSLSEIEEMLRFISPDCNRRNWITVGMAIHEEDPEGFDLWETWSKASEKYPGTRDMLSQWRSFKQDKSTKVTVGTLRMLASKGGWCPSIDTTSLFTSTVTPVITLDDLEFAPPDINLDLFPTLLAARAQEVANSVGCDPLVPLWAGLGAVCAVADARSRLELVEGFRVPPVLWLMTIGNPADKKTPGSRPMMMSLKEIEASTKQQYQQDLVQWEAQEAAYASAKQAFIDFSSSPDAMLGGQPPSIPELPPQPVPLRLTVSDITSQKLIRHASERPQGTLCYLDEMNSWIKKLSDKMNGEDRSAWVVSYESQPYDMDRVGGGSINCENLAISIYGNVQPRVLKDALPALSNDGLLQRFLPVVLRSDLTKLGEPVPDFLTHREQWDNLLRTIYTLPTQQYTLSIDAHREFREFQQWYELSKKDEVLAKTGDLFMTAYGKLEGTCGRMILLFQMIENPFSKIVSAGIVKRIVEIIKSYIIPSFRYCFCNEKSDPITFWLRDHILQNCDKQSITFQEIKRSGRVQFDGMTALQIMNAIMAGMETMEKHHWVIRTDDGSQEHQHKMTWVINPQLMTQFAIERRSVIEAKQRVLDRIQRTSTNKRRVHGNN